MSLKNFGIFLVFCAAILCCSMWDSPYGYLGICLIAWTSFFVLMLVRDYSGGLFISQVAPIVLASMTAILCQPGDNGELARAMLLGLVPVFSGFALYEFFRRIKKGMPLGPFKGIS